MAINKVSVLHVMQMVALLLRDRIRFVPEAAPPTPSAGHTATRLAFVWPLPIYPACVRVKDAFR
ncbi:hypothetical protein ACVWVY_008711 [Bradyrhizobium sp. URHC0002]